MENILVCDDDKEIVDAIEIYLEQEGFKVFKAYDGEEGLDVLRHEEIHLAIVDIMMPKLDGIHMVKELREFSTIPVIFLSAKSEDSDKILGLNIGADDYVTKPFNPLELVARVKSNVRRYTSLGKVVERANVYTSGGLVVDDNAKISDLLQLSTRSLPSLPRTRAKFTPSTRYMRTSGETFP